MKEYTEWDNNMDEVLYKDNYEFKNEFEIAREVFQKYCKEIPEGNVERLSFSLYLQKNV